MSAYDLVFEIDGAGHELPGQQLSDLLRDISVAADGDTVVRIPLALYRLDRDRVLDRIGGLLASRGWRAAA
jgi:very-short-patch-repair endonuclease